MLFSQDICIDPGTSDTRVFVKGKGRVFSEPSVVAVDTEGSGKVVAIGEQAKEMIGRTPGSLQAVCPIRDGVIADFEVTTEMLRALIRKATNNAIFTRVRAMVCVSCGVTDVERRAVHLAARDAGARYVSLISSPMAAAIGANLPINRPEGSMVVDIGGGSTEVAVLSLGDVVSAQAIRVGGKHWDQAIIDYVRRKYNLLIGERTAEDVKIKIGSAFPYEGEGAMNIRGRKLDDGLPGSVEISSLEVRDALYEPLNRVAELLRSTVEKTPPELVGDIMNSGIVLTGGGALLRGMARFLRTEVKIPVTVADDPMNCVIRGAGRCLSDKLDLPDSRSGGAAM